MYRSAFLRRSAAVASSLLVVVVAVRYGIIDRALDARELISQAAAKPTAR